MISVDHVLKSMGPVSLITINSVLHQSAVTLQVPYVLAPTWVTMGSTGCSDMGGSRAQCDQEFQCGEFVVKGREEDSQSKYEFTKSVKSLWRRRGASARPPHVV